jgi:hypothetical protein
LVPQIEGRTYIKGVQEQGVLEKYLKLRGESKRRLWKTA